MSRLLTDRLAIALVPGSVGIVFAPARWRRLLVVSSEVSVGDDGGWQTALSGLDAWLDEHKPRRAELSMIVSNRYVRSALIPWVAGINDAAEETALARATFSRYYGDMPGWTVRCETGRYGAARIAFAVEDTLLESIAALVQKHRLVRPRVQPALVAVWNRWSREIDGKEAIFVAVENGVLTIAIRQGNRWHSVRTLSIGDQQPDALIVREATLQGLEEAPPAWVFAPGQTIELTGHPVVRNLGKDLIAESVTLALAGLGVAA